MPDLVPILPADRAVPERHGAGYCVCTGDTLPAALFVSAGVEVDPRWLEHGLSAREAAAHLSGAGLSSELLLRGQAQACSFLVGLSTGLYLANKLRNEGEDTRG